MKFDQGSGATFTGAITELLPAPLYANNAYSIAFDLTVPATFGGTFARMGISEFGDNAMFGLHGIPVQTGGNAEINIALNPGTHHMTMALIAPGNPFTGSSEVGFPTLFGPDPATQFTAVSFQLYINKAMGSPLTVYLDNVTVQNTQVSVWKTDGDGNWSGSSSWIGVPAIVPNAIDALAMFGAISSSGTRTVTVDSPQTVGGMEFNGSGTFIIGGSSTLTMDVTSGSGSI